MLCIKTGMTDEARIARAFAAPGTLVLQGALTAAELDKIVPPRCTAIMSFGLCGGLGPDAATIGQIFLADRLIAPTETFVPDLAWLHRLFDKTRAYERRWYSSGAFNTANSPQQRAVLFKETRAQVIDDESFGVALFARSRGIPFAILRSVSDTCNETLPPAVRNALNADGSSNVEEVMASVVSDPAQIGDLIRVGDEYYASLATLRRAAIQIGPSFQWSN